MSWIHIENFARAVAWLIEHEALTGVVNLAAPHPLPMRDFMQTIRRAMRQRIGLPAPRPMLEIGAFFLRTETELLPKSRRVIPTRLLESGFNFEYTEWQEAVNNIVQGAK